jgi:hypothetical protein
MESNPDGQQKTRNALRNVGFRTSTDFPGQNFGGHPGPALVDVVSARQELVMPPATTGQQAYNFGLFMLRAVMDGRGQQLVDLAKVNLLR